MIIASFSAFLVMIVLFGGYIASLGIRIAPPANRTTLSMDVLDINSIVVDSNVLLRGVPVGKVTQIDASVTHATIHFYIEGQYQVPVDSDVRLDNLSALGESYIELEPRSSAGPVFRDGQHIAPESVIQPPSISQLGASVVRVLNQLDPKQLASVVNEIDAGFPEPYAVLPNLARTSLLLRNTTADFNGQGREMLSNFQVLLQNAGFVGPALAESADPLRDFAPLFQMAQNALWKATMLTGPKEVLDLSSLLQRIQKLLDDRAPDLRILGEATSENIKLIAAALRNLDSSQILANLLATVPENGAIELRVVMP